MNTARSQRLDATFAALADPTRRAILTRLRAGDVPVNELAAPFHMSVPAVSKHLKVLERAGLVVRRRDAQRRPCRLAAAPLREVVDWVEAYRRHWEESFDRLDAYLQDLQSAPTKTIKSTKTTKPTKTKKEKRHGRPHA